MNTEKLGFKPKFEQSQRIQFLEKRNRDLAVSGKRKLFGGWTGNLDVQVYGWNGSSYTPKDDNEAFSIGDHACWIDIGPFPALDELPSRKDGYKMNAESWAKDYAFMLDNTPPAIHPHERIAGEIYWEMHKLRRYNWHDTDEEIFELGKKARELGCGGLGMAHTCPDLSIGLKQGFKGILKRVQKAKEKYEYLNHPKKVQYLQGLEYICKSNIRFIKRYAFLAGELASKASDLNEAERFKRIEDCCMNISENPPRNYYEAVQWIMFTILFDRSVGHGNGYGRLDLYLIDFYKKDIIENKIDREEARELISEMYMKLRGHFFCVGGRDENLQDATNEMSWIVLEAYDLIGDYNNLGVMWHKDMDKEFYSYACDILARHGQSIPVLVSYDMMYEAELRNGVPHEHAWTVAYSGCQWFCIPGREFCDQDVNTYVAIDPMRRAISRASEDKVTDFEILYKYFEEEVHRTSKAFRNWKRGHDEFIGDLWPEMFTSLLCHGPIEKGLDIVAPRGVEYQFTSVNVLGVPNVSDSLYAIKKLVFEKKRYSLDNVILACKNNWENNEIMRLHFLNEEKYGNDIPGPDRMFARVADSISDSLGSLYNQKGQPFNASLFHFMGHTAPTVIGATPDGRRANEYLAHGSNPTAGRNLNGLIPTANSMTALDLRKFQGAPLQIELQPRFFDGKEEVWKYIHDFSVGFFENRGMQINLHILDLEKLKDAMVHPEKEEYQNIVVRVTGYCARFITLPKSYQEEFITRTTFDL